jgi:hypothetical protein
MPLHGEKHPPIDILHRREDRLQAQGIAWMWEESYQEARNEAGLLLDLLTYFPADRVEKPLRQALEYSDWRLKYFAVVSLLRLGKPVDAKHLQDVASSAEMRNWLYDFLKKIDKSSLFPEAFRTQKAFAEADMVIWLVFARPSASFAWRDTSRSKGGIERDMLVQKDSS